MRKRRPSPDSSKATEPGMVCACKLRVYPTRRQERQMAQWLFMAHWFRNEAVAFITERRRARTPWVKQHPVLAKHWMPDEFAGPDVLACSTWLTERLAAVRHEVVTQWGWTCGRNEMVTQMAVRWPHLTRDERDEIQDIGLLTAPRTVFDQVLQDLSKTISKAIKDRKNKLKKPAGFPTFQKWSFGTSVRLQVDASRNQDMTASWNAGELYIPGLGRLKFRDKQSLPSVPPKLMTVARNAAGHWHVSFVTVDVNSKAKQQAQASLQTPLPVDATTGLLRIVGVDVGAQTLATDSEGKKSERVRYAQRQKKKLARLQRSLARKTKGSKRWHKNVRKVGKLHVKVANQRQAGLREVAHNIVQSSAIICLEDLNLKGLMQHPTLAGSLHDAALGKLKTEILHQAAKHGRLVIECGRWTATTHTCSACQTKLNRKLSLKERSWECPICHSFHDRDINAARCIVHDALTRAQDRWNQYIAGLERGPRTGLSQDAPSGVPWSGLHPDLIRFLNDGGLTAALGVLPWVSRSGGSATGGLDRADEACIPLTMASALVGNRG